MLILVQDCKTFFPERERQMHDVFMRLGGYVGPAVWELGRPQTEEEKQDELIWLKRRSYVKCLGNKMQEQYKTPFAKMSFEDLRAIFIAKMTEQGINSADTIDGEETGVHLRQQGEGGCGSRLDHVNVSSWQLETWISEY